MQSMQHLYLLEDKPKIILTTRWTKVISLMKKHFEL